MEEFRSTSSIIEWFRSAVETRQSIPPSYWVEAGLQLNILREHDDIQYVKLKALLAKEKQLQMTLGGSVAGAKTYIESLPEYTQLLLVEAKIARIEEFIRLAKAYGRLKSEEMRGN